MLSAEIREILASARKDGWVMEPQAKEILRLRGIPVPRGVWAHTVAEAASFAAGIGYPVVAKVVSPEVLHKTEVQGVVVGIRDEEGLTSAFDRLSGIRGSRGVLVEESLSGLELIVGAKTDAQFGPVILVGMGGVRAEIYRDRALRLAPLSKADAAEMLGELQGAALLRGHRGSEPIDEEALLAVILAFSELVMDLGEDLASADLNPVFCSARSCMIADARILLTTSR